MKNSVKNVFESSNWQITNILQGYNSRVRIDAKTRNWQSDEKNFFSEWVTKKYADQLARDNYGKNTNEFACFSY